MARDITVTFADGSQTIYKGAPDDVTPEAVSQRAAQEFGKAVASMDGGRKPGLGEAGKVLDKSVRKGAAALPGLFGEIGSFVMRNMGEPGAMHAPGGVLLAGLQALVPGENPFKESLPAGKVNQTIEEGFGLLPPVSEPETSGGKAIANVAAPAISTMLGGGAGSMMQKAAIGGAGGAGGEAAARMFGDNALSRFLGSLLGGGLAGVGAAYKDNATSIVKRSTEQMNDLDWKKAEAVKKVLEANDIPHLNSQLLGPRSTLDDVVSVAGTNPQVRPRLETAVTRSSTKSQQALDNFVAGKLPPPSGLGERREVLQDVQNAAQQALTTIKQKANTAYTDKMPPEGEHFDTEHVKALRQQLLDLAKSDKFGRGTSGYAFLRGIANKLLIGSDEAVAGAKPGTTMDELDTLLEESVKAGKFVTSKHVINNMIKELNQTAEKEGYKGLALDEAKAVMKAATPDFDDARSAKTAVMNRDYNPASKGLTGDLASMGGGVRPDKTTARESALKIVFPDNRPQPQAILQLEKTMGGDGVGQLLREHLSQQMQSATGMAGKGPAGFVSAIAGTNAQRQNLNAALDVTARANGGNPQEVRRGFYMLMKAFDSFKDLKLPAEIDRAALAQEAGKNLAGVAVAPHSRLGRWFWERATAKTYNQIADIVLAPDGLKKLQEIAKSQDPATARQAAISILSSTMLADPGAQSPGNMNE
jgi:hypothetical protein